MNRVKKQTIARQFIVWEVDGEEVNRKQIRYFEIDSNGVFKGDLVMGGVE